MSGQCPRLGCRRSTIEPWLALNRKYAQLWPNITTKGVEPANAKGMESIPNKLRYLFSERPGGFMGPLMHF